MLSRNAVPQASQLCGEPKIWAGPRAQGAMSELVI